MMLLNVRELRARRSEILTKARELSKKAELEDRDLTEEEQEQFDEWLTEADALEQRSQRLEALDEQTSGLDQRQGTRAGGRNVPNLNTKTARGDSETKALANYFRTGDRSAVSNLIEEDERGVRAVVLRVPTQKESRAVVDSTMNIATAADGGNIIPTGFVQDVALRKNEMMLAERLGVRRVPGKGTTVNYPIEGADPEEFATTGEQADDHSVNYERDAGVTNLKAFTLAKKTRKIELTEELLEDEDVGLLDYIADRIARQVAGTHNNMLLTEVAANGTALKTFASTSAIAAGEIEDMIYHDTLGFYLGDDAGAIHWVSRPTTYGAIVKITGNDRLYSQTPSGDRFQRTLEMYPVHWSNKASAIGAGNKSLFFGNWDQVGYREAPAMRFIMDPYSVDGLVILKYSFRAVYGVLQAGGIGYGQHPTA